MVCANQFHQLLKSLMVQFFDLMRILKVVVLLLSLESLNCIHWRNMSWKTKDFYDFILFDEVFCSRTPSWGVGGNTTGRYLRSFSKAQSHFYYNSTSCNPRVFPEIMAMLENERGFQKYNENGCNNNKTPAIRDVIARIKMFQSYKSSSTPFESRIIVNKLPLPPTSPPPPFFRHFIKRP